MNPRRTPRPARPACNGARWTSRPSRQTCWTGSAPSRSRTWASPGSITTGPLRQGFPEVIFGLGKTPAQIAAIAERIVSRGQTLLVTRTTPEAFEAVRAVVPDAVYHEQARIIERRAGELPRGTGTILVAAAGTSDLPVAEEAAVTAEVMGNPWTGCTTSASPGSTGC